MILIEYLHRYTRGIVSYFSGVFYHRLIRPFLFSFPPEKAHHLAFAGLRGVGRVRGLLKSIMGPYREEEKVQVAGITFPNRVGLAAGFDKDGKCFRELGELGFGFVEVGTVTPLPQPGNEQPRLFRLPADQALINRMGFNNEGLAALRERLKNRPPGLIIGGNIGKNKATPVESAADDYVRCAEVLFDVVDYFVVNVSSPNTPGLRTLQDKEPLSIILNKVQQVNYLKSSDLGLNPRPVFLKIAPDLTDSQLDDIIDVVLQTGIAGVIATNTTLSREGLKTDPATVQKIGLGGLSGRPLVDRSTEVIRYLASRSQKRFAIIGVGGIHSPQDALDKVMAGADLVQLYTGFIYEGPGLIRQIRKALLR